MKPPKILLFILIIIACLAVAAALFPLEGIPLFNKTLRFPALSEILTRTHSEEIDPEEILKQWEIKPMRNEEDTLSLRSFCFFR